MRRGAFESRERTKVERLVRPLDGLLPCLLKVGRENHVAGRKGQSAVLSLRLCNTAEATNRFLRTACKPAAWQMDEISAHESLSGR